MKIKNCFSLLALLFLFSSCYYDKEEKIYGLVPCDTSNVKYSIQITSTISTNCLRCHGGTASAGGGILLGNFNVLQGLALNGRLMGALSHAAGYSPMPKNSPSLDECRLAEFRTWIRNGAINN